MNKPENAPRHSLALSSTEPQTRGRKKVHKQCKKLIPILGLCGLVSCATDQGQEQFQPANEFILIQGSDSPNFYYLCEITNPLCLNKKLNSSNAQAENINNNDAPSVSSQSKNVTQKNINTLAANIPNDRTHAANIFISDDLNIPFLEDDFRSFLNSQKELSIYFNFNSSYFAKNAKYNVAALANFLNKKYLSGKILIKASTDPLGDERVNEHMANKRALRVRDALVKQGINPDVIVISELPQWGININPNEENIKKLANQRRVVLSYEKSNVKNKP